MSTATENKSDFSELAQKLGAGFLSGTTGEERAGLFPIVWVKREALPEALRFLKESPSYRMHQLSDLTAIDRLYDPAPHGDRFELVYCLHNLETERRVVVKAAVPESDLLVESATPLWRAANWAEREVFDQYGIRFKNHPNLRRLLNHREFVGHPLRKDYDIFRGQWLTEADDLMEEMELRRREKGTPAVHDEPGETMILNIGPSHPATHGTLRSLVELDGETILHAVPEIGYLHRGFEKSAETHEYNQVIPYTDRLNYCSALSNNVGYAKAVEQLCGIEVPERCQYIRVILCELNRIMDHLVGNGANIVDLGALTNFWYLFNLREKIYTVIEGLTGARLTNSYTRIGGLWADATDEFLAQTRAVLKEVPRHVGDTLKLVARNRIFIDRCVGVGKISVDDAISFGMTGPCLRATGLEYDLRKNAPYYVYDRFKFEVPTGHQGDTYDRIMVRFEECLQSVKIIEQALDQMPKGPFRADHPLAVMPEKKDTYGSIEGLVNHFKVVMHGISPPKGEVYDCTESPNGELGFYVVSDGTMRPYKCKVRPPCFYTYAAFPQMAEGGLIADAVAVLGSINIIAGELDR
ncbi:MAG: NADH dehydrogenase (quinone) subunit D [Candidatus Eisenbacteria bacterium]|nr:NADH dehydrogenase (quinone) subunit D [Candidatus Eisenbacteria bacterium]